MASLNLQNMFAVAVGFMLSVAVADSARAEAAYAVEINKGKLVKLSSDASTVVVADPEIADVQVVSPRLVYISGRHVGETSVVAVNGRDDVVLDGTISVTHNLSKLRKAITSAMPGSNIDFDSTDSAIILKGDVESPANVASVQQMAASFLGSQQNVINMLQSKDGDQVMLKVRIAEVSRNELKRFGINLESLLTSGNFLFGVATGRDIVDDVTGLIPRSDAGDNSFYTGLNTDSVDINGVIDALEDDGLVTVLAEPNLTTKSGVSANFLAGGEFPIPVVGEDDSVTIDYRQFGVSLDFTPVVMSKDKISLTVRPEVSTLSTLGAVTINGFNVPTLLTRRASTTVELGSGESFAIAGLLRRDNSNDISKVPALGDIPVLGALFRSSEFREDQTELVIIVTPYTVKGTTDTELATPVDYYQPANDLERILLGKLYRETIVPEDKTGAEAVAAATPAPRLNGPSGHLMR